MVTPTPNQPIADSPLLIYRKNQVSPATSKLPINPDRINEVIASIGAIPDVMGITNRIWVNPSNHP
jgi:hypothetical protein